MNKIQVIWGKAFLKRRFNRRSIVGCGTLLTLADARRYVLAMKDGREHRSGWVAAIRLMMGVGEAQGDMDEVTQQLKIALTADGQSAE